MAQKLNMGNKMAETRFCECMQTYVQISEFNLDGGCPGLNCQQDWCNKVHCDFWRKQSALLKAKQKIPTPCTFCMDCSRQVQKNKDNRNVEFI